LLPAGAKAGIGGALRRRHAKWHTLAEVAPTHHAKDRQLAKPNYEFAKRQRDLAKKQKKEEKRKRKTGADDTQPGAESPAAAQQARELGMIPIMHACMMAAHKVWM
jgi:hypothetical protein